MSTRWAAEACDRRYDPESGALVTQLTSSAASSINIYCEQPYTSPDGNRVAILRRYDVSFDRTWRLLVADLTTLHLALIEPGGVVGVCNAAWSGLLHYSMEDGSLRRVDLQTLHVEPVPVPPEADLRDRGASVSPDHRFNHVNVSRCGRYFVSDSFTAPPFDESGEIRAAKIDVGDLDSGKHRVLVEDSRSSGGGGQHMHVHAYFTADNRNVIFNADPFGGPTQVWAARVPEGFLQSLK